jgi:tetratricopeptide (TPR) repeat protein
MSEADCQTCPSCGERVMRLVSGLCPRCLLANAQGGDTTRDGESAAGDAGETPAEGTARAAANRREIPGHAGLPIDRVVPVIGGSFSGAATPKDRSARLELFGEIGRGGMGVVLRGRDPDLGRELAVKVLRDDLRGSPEMVRRFVEEAQIAGQLQHPGIVPIHELGKLADDLPYFTMKLVKGQTLSQLLALGTTSEANRARVLGIFEQVCQTVAYAHAHGVIHRDLKPSNVMVGSYGEVQVMDWGLAKVIRVGGGAGESTGRAETPLPATVIATARSLSDSDLSSAGSVLGTPSYMAPEQARGEVEAVDERADVFALGSILCEILSGQPAFTGPRPVDIQRRAADGDLSGAWLRLEGCGADVELVALARDCLAPERDGRPRDAGVVAERVTAYLAGVQQRLRAAEVARAAESARAEEATRTALAARAQARAERRALRLTAVLAAAGVGLLAIVGGGAAWLQRQDALRAATTGRLVNDALAEAMRREGEARTRGANDPAGWDVALAEARRALDLLKQGRADAALRGRVDAVVASLSKQRDLAAERAERLKVDRRLLADLDAARTGATDLGVVDRAYAAAFVAAGLDVDRTEPRAIGEWIAARPARSDLVIYLDDWAHIRRWSKPGPGPGQHREADLVSAARVADPDPWRDRLRAAHKDPTALRALADDEPGLEGQPAKSLHLLAVALNEDGGDWERAVRVLRLAWRRFPNDFWTNIQMTRFLATKIAASPPDQRGRWIEDRVRFLAAAVAARPTSVLALYQLGDALVDSGRAEDALEAYRGATRLRPGTAPYTLLGDRLRGQKKLNEAVAAYREAIRMNPDDVKAHLELGTILRDQKQLEESLAQLHEVIRLKPKNGMYHFYYGLSLEASGRRDDAIAAYREAFRLDCEEKKVGSAPYWLAWNLRRAGQPGEAIAVLYKALSIKPDEEGFHNLASQFLTQERRWAEALKHVVWLSEHNPADPLLAAKIAVLRFVSGDDAGYRRQCAVMLDRFGKQPGPPALCAVESCMLGDRPVEVERASRLIEAEFRRAAAANPKASQLGDTQLIMAMADYRSGRFAHAAELARGLRGTGRRLEIAAEIILAMASHRLGDKGLARQELASATRAVRAGLDAHDEWDGHWLDWLICDALLREARALIDEGTTPGESGPTGLSVVVDYPFVEILLRAGRFDEAITTYREALLRKPDDARIEKNLGELLAQRGRWDEALKVVDKAALLDPSNDGLWLQVTTLHLYLGDDAGYRRGSLVMLDRFGATKPARAVKSCLLSARPVELERACQLSKGIYERARASDPKAEHYGWAQLDWALAEYRMGHYERAADHLKRCRVAGGVLGLLSESLLAMTYQRLGLKAEAGRLLSSCRKALSEIAGRTSGWGFEWHDYLSCEIFCREAEALIRDDAARSTEGKAADPPGRGAKAATTPASGNARRRIGPG